MTLSVWFVISLIMTQIALGYLLYKVIQIRIVVIGSVKAIGNIIEILHKFEVSNKEIIKYFESELSVALKSDDMNTTFKTTKKNSIN